MSKQIKLDYIPYVVLIGVPNWMELDKVRKHLDENEISYASFVDTDFDFGVAAVVTVPLEEEQRKFLRYYPLWKG